MQLTANQKQYLKSKCYLKISRKNQKLNDKKKRDDLHIIEGLIQINIFKHCCHKKNSYDPNLNKQNLIGHNNSIRGTQKYIQNSIKLFKLKQIASTYQQRQILMQSSKKVVGYKRKNGDLALFAIIQYFFRVNICPLLKAYQQFMEEKPKSIRAIRRLRKKEPKMIQGTRNTLFIRGNKSSNEVTSIMKDLRALRRVHAVQFSRKHDIHPFQSREELEHTCKKSETSLFLFGSHTKKRPSNIVIGRTYEHKVLDMVELGILNFQSIQDLIASAQVPYDVQPFIIFQGDLWESDEHIKKLKNLINDFFLMNNRPKGVEIDKAMKMVVCWSVTEDKKLFMHTYEVSVEGGAAILNQQGKLVIEQLGPNAQFALRRHSFADDETWKKATHIPKPKKKKQNKNVRYDSVGNKRGKLYVDRQNLKSLPFKRRKLISKGGKKEGQNIGQSKHEDEFAQ